MKINNYQIIITLEKEEINIFWNIIAFALDLDTKENCMTGAERNMANKLYDATKERY